MTKKCFKCDEVKDIDMFYSHPKNLDGKLNKCKDCTKKDAIKNYAEKSNNKDFVEKERERGREKYKRLNYYDKYKEQTIVKTWLLNPIYKNLNRSIKCEKGIECHHWSYNDNHLKDIILLTRKAHKKVHKHLILDINKRLFLTLDGIILDTREKHEEYLKQFIELITHN